MAAENRHSKQTERFDGRELAKSTETEVVTVPITEVEDAIDDWGDDELAVGTPKPGTPKPELHLFSRTMTKDDPLTTGLLAEVTRRPMVEVDGDWVLTSPLDEEDVAVIVDPAPDPRRKP